MAIFNSYFDITRGYIPAIPTGFPQVAFEIIDLDRHGEIGATDLRRALQSPGAKWLAVGGCIGASGYRLEVVMDDRI